MHKILFVDDEPMVLDGYRRTLYREFDIQVARSGAEGLQAIDKDGPYPVIVSDMRMAGMSGSQFLAAVKEKAPDTVRMLLTGYTDVNAAIDAVNQGNIFRFLTKPCDKETLVKALTTGVEQYDLIRVERELLEKTLMGSIKVLTEVLSAASPDAFGRSIRITRYVRHISMKCIYSARWQLAAAASLSQLGCITLDSEVIQRAYEGTRLTPEEQARYKNHPQIARELLENIPRLGPVAWMISHQLTTDIPQPPAGLAGATIADMVLGAKILKLAVAFDDLKMTSLPDANAINRLRGRTTEFDESLISALSDMEPERGANEARKLPIARLKPGMILNQEVRSRAGMLIVGVGQEVTRPLIAKLDNFARAGTIESEIMVLANA